MKKLLLYGAIALSLNSFAQTPTYVPSNGLVGWWPFNGNANDESGNAYNGTVNGAALTTDRLGATNSAYSFNGNSAFIQTPTSAVNFPSGFTISVWAKVLGANTNCSFGCAEFLVTKGDDGQSGRISIQYSQNTGASGKTFAGATDYSLAVNSLTQYPFPQPNWHHVVYTFDNTNYKIYLDGLLMNTIASTTAIPNLASDIVFGKMPNNTSFPYYFNGYLDDIGIWNHALTPGEITNLYSAVNCASPTGTHTITECDAYTWIDGNTYTTSNNTATFTIFGGASSGCDSIVNLDLTITTDTSYTNITACDSVVWNGTTYNSSGTYTGSSISNNYSASLDGINDYVDVGNNSVLDVDNSVTIEAWINPANLSNRHAIYSTRKNNDPGSFQLEIGSDVIGTNYVAVTGVSTYVAITGNNVINTSSGWVHIAYTRDGVGTNHQIYINGIPQIITTSPYTFINNNASKEIGRGTNLLQNYDGQIDQVRIWDIALTQLEIQNYMDCSPQVNEVGLVGYWNFEEGSGTTAFDLTSNANNGTLNGATYDTDAPSQLCPFTNTAGCDSVAILNLTIGASTGTDTQLTCSSYTWIDGNTYTTNTNTATFNIIGGAAAGCDSIVTLDLTITPDTSYTNITACDSVVWNGTTYNSSGSYTGSSISNNYSASLDGINDYVDVGNNSVLDVNNSVTIEAWINPANLSNRHAIYSTRKNNDPGSFQLEIGSDAVGTNYVAVTGVSTYVAITGNNVINTSSGWVHIAYTRDGVGTNHQIYINGIPQIINTNPYTFINNNASKEIGRGTSLLQNYQGQIDQVRIWDIALTQLEIQNYMDCSPQVNEVGLVGYWNFEEGSGTTAFDLTSNANNGTLNGATYDTDAPSQLCPFTNTAGCDSVAILNLTIGAITGTDTQLACNSYTWIDGNTYTTNNNTATFNIIGGAAGGCDSLVTLDLTIVNSTIPALNLGNDSTICSGNVLVLDAGLTYDTYNWSTSDTTQTIAVNSAGTYFVEVASNTNASTGPDLITNSDFSSNGAFWNACANTTEAYAPETIYGGSNATNIVAEIDAGPDNTIGTADDMSLCQTVAGLTIGESYQLCFNYSRRDIGPNPTTTFITIDGGSLNQTLIASNSTFAFTQACYTFTATQTTHLLSFTPGNSGQEGMILDDISTHVLTSLSCYTSDTIQVFVETPVQTVSFSNPICFGDNNGNIHIDNPLAFEYSSDGGTNWQIDSFFVNLTSGNYNICSRTALACTVCDTVILNSLPQVSGTDTRTECNSYTWIDGINYTANNNSATFNILGGAANGCDSLVTLDLTIVNSTSGTDTRTECNSYTWIDGNTYTASNNSATFNIVGGAANGCDSLVTLDLTIVNSTSGTETRSECNSYTWIDGVNYTSNNNSATFNITNGAANGCDSLVTLNLTIVNSTSGTDTKTECNSYTWIDGINYTANNNSATFNILGGAANGCDSLVTLDLTIVNSTSGTDTRTECNSYTWIDGNTYTASNNSANNNSATFNIVGGAANGCDSLVTLDLTIVNSTSGTDTRTECNSYTWIDGINYSANNNSATFNITNGAANGCDSLVTLDLTIVNSTSGTETRSECNSYTWIDGVNYTSNNNSATFNITNGAANGCDSLVTLNLTILNATSGTDTRTECNSYTWIDGINYTASNNSATFNIVGGAANGCDSLVTLNLTILNATSVTDTRTECNSYTWIDGINYTASNNSATFNIVGGAANGCDSLVTLDLTINNVTDITTSSSGAIITANNLGATYQWLDCDSSNATITGETGQSYTVVANGNYAVELTENGCIDTSACVNIITTAILENNFGSEFNIYPNPTKGNFSVDLDKAYNSILITITDLSGRLIESKEYNGTKLLNLKIDEPAGIYLLKIETGNQKAVIRLVKE